MDQPHTIALVVEGAEQLDGLLRDLQRSQMVNAGTVMLLVSSDPSVRDRFRALHDGEASLTEMPNPDVVVYDTVFTIALNAPAEDVLAIIQQVYEKED